jgi:hypothetical protein
VGRHCGRRRDLGTAAAGRVWRQPGHHKQLDGFDDLIIGAFNDEKAIGSARAGQLQGITASGQGWRQGQSEIGETPKPRTVRSHRDPFEWLAVKTASSRSRALKPGDPR